MVSTVLYTLEPARLQLLFVSLWTVAELCLYLLCLYLINIYTRENSHAVTRQSYQQSVHQLVMHHFNQEFSTAVAVINFKCLPEHCHCCTLVISAFSNKMHSEKQWSIVQFWQCLWLSIGKRTWMPSTVKIPDSQHCSVCLMCFFCFYSLCT